MPQQEVSSLPDKYGNYDSPALKSLREVWDDYDQEKVEPDKVLQVIDNIWAYIENQIQEIEERAEDLGPHNKNANRETILDGFYEHLRGLELMRDFFQQEDASLIDEGFEQIQEATNLLMLGFQGLIEESLHEIPKLCVRCGRENGQDATSCRRCGAILPVLTEFTNANTLSLAIEDDDKQEAAEAETTPNFIEVSDAYQSWQLNQIDSEGFLEVVLRVHKIQFSDLQELEKTLTKEQANNPDGNLAQVLTQVSISLNNNIASLESLAEAIKRDEKAELEEGLQSFAATTIELIDASKKLVTVQANN